MHIDLLRILAGAKCRARFAQESEESLDIGLPIRLIDPSGPSSDLACFGDGLATSGLASSAMAGSLKRSDKLERGGPPPPLLAVTLLLNKAGVLHPLLPSEGRRSKMSSSASSRSTSSLMILFNRGSSTCPLMKVKYSSFFLCQADLHMKSMHLFHLEI